MSVHFHVCIYFEPDRPIKLDESLSKEIDACFQKANMKIGGWYIRNAKNAVEGYSKSENRTQGHFKESAFVPLHWPLTQVDCVKLYDLDSISVIYSINGDTWTWYELFISFSDFRNFNQTFKDTFNYLLIETFGSVPSCLERHSDELPRLLYVVQNLYNKLNGTKIQASYDCNDYDITELSVMGEQKLHDYYQRLPKWGTEPCKRGHIFVWGLYPENFVDTIDFSTGGWRPFSGNCDLFLLNPPFPNPTKLNKTAELPPYYNKIPNASEWNKKAQVPIYYNEYHKEFLLIYGYDKKEALIRNCLFCELPMPKSDSDEDFGRPSNEERERIRLKLWQIHGLKQVYETFGNPDIYLGAYKFVDHKLTKDDLHADHGPSAWQMGKEMVCYTNLSDQYVLIIGQYDDGLLIPSFAGKKLK